MRTGAKLAIGAGALAAIALVATVRSRDVEPPAAPDPLVRPRVETAGAVAPPEAVPSVAIEPPIEAERPREKPPDWDGTGDPSRDFVRARIESLIAERFADRQLRSGELESVVDAALAMHEVNRELGSLQDDPDAAERREAALDRGRRAADTWRAILEIEPLDLPSPR